MKFISIGFVGSANMVVPFERVTAENIRKYKQRLLLSLLPFEADRMISLLCVSLERTEIQVTAEFKQSDAFLEDSRTPAYLSFETKLAQGISLFS